METFRNDQTEPEGAADNQAGTPAPAAEVVETVATFDLGKAAPGEPAAVAFEAVEPVAPSFGSPASSLDLPSLELPNAVPPPAPYSPPQTEVPMSSVPSDLPPAAAGAAYPQYSAQESYGATPAPQPVDPYAQPGQYAPQPGQYAQPDPYAQPAAPDPYAQAAYSQPYAQQPYAQPNQMVPAGTGMDPAQEATWVSGAHWSSLVASLVSMPFLGPLIVLLVQGPKSAKVREAAVESLNFDLTMMIGMLASLVLMFVMIGFITMPIIALLWLVFKIIAAVQPASAPNYRYPLNIRMVK